MEKEVALSENQIMALDLIEEGLLTTKEIAEATKIDHWELLNLCAGKPNKKYGEVVELFKSEIESITKRNAEKIKYLIKENKKLALLKMNEFLITQRGKSTTKAMMKEIVSCINALNKSAPSVEIGSLHYTKGLSAEDLIYEFSRLRSIAQHSLKQKRIHGSGQGEAGVLSLPSRTGDSGEAE